MTNEERQELETIGDRLEGLARNTEEWKHCAHGPCECIAKRLMFLAWDLKQIAREGTASEGL